jgi:uncharacterized spore protein YtfJ
MTSKPNVINMDHIASTLTSAFNSKIIFSDPIEKDGVTVIPVAKVIYGLGGGTGTRAHDKGEGGGGGFFAKPVGYIELRNGTAHFKAIRAPLTYAPVIMAAGLAGYFLLKGLTRLFHKKA